MMRAFNGVGRLLRRCGRDRPLTFEYVRHWARFKSGLNDWGDEAFLDPLRRVVESYEETAELTPFGRTAVGRCLVQFAANRLRIHNLVTDHPEIADIEIRRPIFIVGLPRTGTTLLYGLMGEHPACRVLRGYEAFWPVPLPSVNGSTHDRRIPIMGRLLGWLHHVAPDLQSIHAMSAEAPEETTLVMANSFMAPTFGMMGRVDSYDAWLGSLDRSRHVPAYDYLKRQLQVLQWQHAGDQWLLKSPIHLPTLDALLEVFPDACVVQTHRDPAKVVASTCSLYAVMRGIFSDRVDRHELGRKMAGDLADAVQRARDVRHRHPDRFFDVRFQDLMADKIGTVRRIYRHFDLPCDAEVERRLEAWIEQDNHAGGHQYDLAQFGLSVAEIDRLFEGYREEFDVAEEVPRTPN